MMSDQKIGAIWSEAMRMAHVAMAAEGSSSFPDKSDVVAVACAFLSGGFVVADKAPRSNRHAGVDADQSEKLNSAYGSGNEA